MQINDEMNKVILAFHKFAMSTYYFCLGWGGCKWVFIIC